MTRWIEDLLRSSDHYGHHRTKTPTPRAHRGQCIVRRLNHTDAVATVTDVPFSEELPRLLSERRMSTRALAMQIGVSPSHLSRVIRRKDYKTPGLDLMQ